MLARMRPGHWGRRTGKSTIGPPLYTNHVAVVSRGDFLVTREEMLEFGRALVTILESDHDPGVFIVWFHDKVEVFRATPEAFKLALDSGEIELEGNPNDLPGAKQQPH